MKKLILIITLFFLTCCSTGKKTYWCGDRPCINNEEKEAYFKKTMIVEIKDIEKKSSKTDSEIEKIILQAQKKDKKKNKEKKYFDKQTKLEAKRKKKDEKRSSKQRKLEAKEIEKEKKKIAREAKLEAKRIEKEKQKLTKQTKTDESKKIKNEENEEAKTSTNSDFEREKLPNFTTSFSKLVEEITNRNILRPYPDINDIQD